MSEKRARYVGHPDGADLSIHFRDGDIVHVHIAHGAELPSEVQGRKVPAAYVASLLEQEANWSAESAGKSDTAKAGTKEGDR